MRPLGFAALSPTYGDVVMSGATSDVHCAGQGVGPE